MTPRELGQILRAKRKEARLSAVQLGALLGCSDLVVKKTNTENDGLVLNS